jgi:CTP synthase (UTP-ammonia lyase)
LKKALFKLALSHQITGRVNAWKFAQMTAGPLFAGCLGVQLMRQNLLLQGPFQIEAFEAESSTQ